MKILVIGNGFDLAHGLPTSYREFLEFCKRAKRIFTYNNAVSLDAYEKKNIEGWCMNDSIKNVLLSAFKNRTPAKGEANIHNVVTPNKLLNELYTHIDNNTWLRHFEKCQSYIGENWIDFEAEILEVIQALDAVRFQVESGNSIDYILADEVDLALAICEISGKRREDVFESTNSIDKFSQYLLMELERLTRALEIYIAGFVQDIKVTSKSVDIEQIKPDRILSFNYSNTYERVYGSKKNIKYDYIHGKADIDKNISTCNMVLGINEYLDDDRKDLDLEFLPFKKYFQRIYKQTGNQYLNWVDRIHSDWAAKNEATRNQTQAFISENNFTDGENNSYSTAHFLYIFGHSLDVTDGDVLRRLILNDNVKTNIFYYRKNESDKRDLKQKITKLIKIIGQDELIKRTGGLTRTIEFIPQSFQISNKRW